MDVITQRLLLHRPRAVVLNFTMQYITQPTSVCGTKILFRGWGLATRLRQDWVVRYWHLKNIFPYFNLESGGRDNTHTHTHAHKVATLAAYAKFMWCTVNEHWN